MNELEPRIHDKSNGLDYVLVGDYYILDLKLDESLEQRPIGKWGRMHRDYLKEYRPAAYSDLVISGKLWTYLADLNEQAQARLELIIEQMKAAEGVDWGFKASGLVELGATHGKYPKSRRRDCYG